MPIERARTVSSEIAMLSPRARAGFLTQLCERLLARREELIDRIQQETRKSRTDALMSEIFPVVDHLHFFAKEAPRALSDRKIPTPVALMGKRSEVWLEPLGVVLVISPWNYPLFQALVPCALSFICGNATVYKPSEFTPLRGVVEGLLQEAGFQRDWVQIVYGDGKTGDALVAQGPDKVFFTGSVHTGKKIMARAAEKLVPVELELGGKDPMIVFADANLGRAAAGAVWGALTNLGQSCTSVERIYVQDSIFDDFSRRVVEETARLTQKIDADGSADLGEMTTDAQVGIVQAQLDEAKAQGAKILFEGVQRGGRALPPVVLDLSSAPRGSSLEQEETFGPVIPLIRFKDEAEAIARANDSKYGLSASVWTRDLRRAERVSRALKVGNVSINNVMLTEANPALPFGGIKDSGFGRYKGEWGFASFSNVKSVLWDRDSSKREVNWYPYTARKYALFVRMMEALFSRGILKWIRFAYWGLRLESDANSSVRKGARK